MTPQQQQRFKTVTLHEDQVLGKQGCVSHDVYCSQKLFFLLMKIDALHNLYAHYYYFIPPNALFYLFSD